MIGSRSSLNTQHLGKHLERGSLVTREQWQVTLQVARRDNRHPVEVALETIPAREKALDSLAEYFRVPSIRLMNRIISPYVITLLPKAIAEEHGVVIFKKVRGKIHVATTNPENSQTIAFIEKQTKLKTEVYLTTPEDLAQALKKYPEDIAEQFSRIIERSTQEALALHDTEEKMAQYLPIVTMVNTIFERALEQRASDIHIEPKGERISIRFRVDGILRTIVELPTAVLPSLVTRLKLLASLKIDEHRMPQDGRLNFSMNGREVAVRVSIVPTLYGPTTVLRLLDTKETRFTLRGLGFHNKDLSFLKQHTTQPHGLILVTGPTGSGKTTTLYTLLRMLNKQEVNICTIEDPVEYSLDGVSQTQVNPAAGLTFAHGLRSLLRQDPNIIMVGEIRDRETAMIAVNAAMTGHLVLSSLHTNSASLALQRLVEMGVEPYLIASVTNVILGQRLVRRICPDCRSVVRNTQKVIDEYRSSLAIESMFASLRKRGVFQDFQKIRDARIVYGRGCPKCLRSGYRGRTGIYEVLVIDDHVREAMLKEPTATSIERAAKSQGMTMMLEDGLYKALTGVTTFDEVLRVMK
jgi:type IV pilus assembly protein PilB